ncbi:MAG: glycosyltransferase family 39 protein [Thermodesulfobacteriota bacterium]
MMPVKRLFASPPWSGLSLLLLALAVYLPALAQLPLIRAEAMYALIPKEMWDSGQWLLPFLNGARYLDKPPLLYWLNLLAYQIFGVSELTARLPILAFALGEIWFTYLIGLRLLGPRAAWLGGLILLSSVGFFALHLQILTDHLISLTLTGSLYFLLRWQERPAFLWAALFYLALAVGFLSKGFIGLAFPVLIGGLYFLWIREPRLVRLFFLPQGLALLALLAAPWFVLVERANPGFLQHQIVNEQILRFLGQRHPPDITPFSIPGFWLFLGLWLMPWTFLLPSALYHYLREKVFGPAAPRAGGLLLIWPLVILVFFTLSASRIEYYSLPALPPLALLVGWQVVRYFDTPRDWSLLGGFVVVALLGLALLFLLPYLEQLCADNRREFIGMFPLIRPVARQATFAIPLVALVGALLSWRHSRQAFMAYALLALMLLYFTFQTLSALSPHLSDKLPGDYIRREAGPKDLVVMESIEEFEYGASFAFYGGRRILMVQRSGLPKFPYPVPPEENYIITPDRLRELWQGPGRVFLLVDDASPLEPYLKGAPVALASTGKRLLTNR